MTIYGETRRRRPSQIVAKRDESVNDERVGRFRIESLRLLDSMRIDGQVGPVLVDIQAVLEFAVQDRGRCDFSRASTLQ